VRALLSVYDKEGLVELAQGLADLGWELVASGNTSAELAGAGIAHHLAGAGGSFVHGCFLQRDSDQGRVRASISSSVAFTRSADS